MTFTDDGDTRGVVTAIFELTQTINDEWYYLLVSNVANNSADKVSLVKVNDE